MSSLLTFPNPVNEKAARTVALGVVGLTVATLVSGWYWLLVPLAYGFWARLLSGPTLSPLGRVAQDVIAPRLGARRPVAGPPKRFAQGIGAAFSTAALVLGLVLGRHLAADVVLAVLLLAAGLEAFAGVCLGCIGFGMLMRAGVVPEAVCAECADIGGRLAAARATAGRAGP